MEDVKQYSRLGLTRSARIEGTHLVHSPLPEPYDPAGHTAPQLFPSGDRPVPASPAQHSPLAQDEVQAVALVMLCAAMPQLCV